MPPSVRTMFAGLARGAPLEVDLESSSPQTPPRPKLPWDGAVTPEPLEAPTSSGDAQTIHPEESSGKVVPQKQRLQNQVTEMVREREEYQAKLREIKSQAADWRRRREELRLQLRDLPEMGPEEPRAEKRSAASPGAASSKRSRGSLGQSNEGFKPDPAAGILSKGSYLPPAEVRKLVGEEPCAICLEPLKAKAKTIALCGHIFHMACLMAARGGVAGATCPQCRSPVDKMSEDRLQSLTGWVLAASRLLPCEVANLREVELSRLLEQVNMSVRRDRDREATTNELKQVLSEMEAEGGVLVHGTLVTFT
ncbi:unnamed protein product [Polarella glacialis]|uniref:RING-type domain-containing protein n=1 Tax=Polarella glacialis TaxID=89957 RepID=A0A813KQB0_POLGL|nr:unnamed protein product [Polarella glacialis]